MAKIQIIVGSVNGRAWQTANAVARLLSHQGHQVRVNDEPSVPDLLQDTEEVLLVCCSTTGEGDLPDYLYPLFYALDTQSVDLQGRRYGVIALGDSGYRHFAQAGYLLENALYSSGAKRIGEMCVLDARRVDNHPLAAALWANEWVAGLAC
jgi:MioC protein